MKNLEEEISKLTGEKLLAWSEGTTAVKTYCGKFAIINNANNQVLDIDSKYAEKIYKVQYENHRYNKAMEWSKNQLGNAGDD